MGVKARAKAHAKSRDPKRDAERRAKIGAACRGKPRPQHVIEVSRAAHLGIRHADEARRKMREAHARRLGT